MAQHQPVSTPFPPNTLIDWDLITSIDFRQGADSVPFLRLLSEPRETGEWVCPNLTELGIALITPEFGVHGEGIPAESTNEDLIEALGELGRKRYPENAVFDDEGEARKPALLSRLTVPPELEGSLLPELVRFLVPF